MKKICLFVCLFVCLFSSNLNAWHGKTLLTYRGEMELDIEAKYKTINNHCETSASYSGKITELLNITVISGIGVCRKKEKGKIICSKSFEEYFEAKPFGLRGGPDGPGDPGKWSPDSFSGINFKLYGDGNQILEKIGVPLSKFNISSGIVKLESSSNLPLLTKPGGNIIETPNLGVKNKIIDLGIYSYSDPSECPIKVEVPKTREKCDNYGKNCKTERYTEIEDVTPYEKINIPQQVSNGSSSVGGFVLKNSETGIINPNIKDVNYKYNNSASNCKKLDNNYFTCYATDKNIDFIFDIGGFGSYLGGSIFAFINNLNSNLEAGPNSKIIVSKEINFTGETKVSFNNGFFKKEGIYEVKLQLYGNTDLPYTGGKAVKIILKIVPNPHYLETKTESDNLLGDKSYANGENKYKYDISIKDKFGNIIKQKQLKGIICPISTEECLLDNSSPKKSGIVLNSKLSKTDDNGKTSFNIVSYVPNKYSGNNPIGVKPTLEGKVEKWGPDYENLKGQTAPFSVKTENDKIFKEPITYDGFFVEGGNINVTKSQKYHIELKNEGDLKNYRKGKIEGITKENFKLPADDYKYKEFNVKEEFGSNIISNKEAKLNKIVGVIATINAKKDDIIKSAISLELNNLYVNYIVNGFNVKYFLRNIGRNDYCEVKTTGLIINGVSHSKGKEIHTSELSTFSNLSKAEVKRAIDKNSKDLIRGLTSGNKVNGILYYKGENVTYSKIEDKLQENDSLVIENGNLLIDKNIEENIGIVVLSDNVKIGEISKKSKGNIFVKNNVTKINAFIYADGGFISAKSLEGDKYTDEELREHKLDLKGSIISSNTVGGGEKGDNSCKLPGNTKIEDCDLAERYDLNYIRKHIMQCENNMTEEQKKNNYSFKIEYNPKIQTNPSKIFTIRK